MVQIVVYNIITIICFILKRIKITESVMEQQIFGLGERGVTEESWLSGGPLTSSSWLTLRKGLHSEHQGVDKRKCIKNNIV